MTTIGKKTIETAIESGSHWLRSKQQNIDTAYCEREGKFTITITHTFEPGKELDTTKVITKLKIPQKDITYENTNLVDENEDSRNPLLTEIDLRQRRRREILFRCFDGIRSILDRMWPIQYDWRPADEIRQIEIRKTKFRKFAA